MLFTLVLLAVAAAGPAVAHSTLDKKSVPANTDVEVSVQAPVEEVNAYNQRLILEVPDGFVVLSCGEVQDFACTQSRAENPKRTVLTWERTEPGQPIPFMTDRFPFRMHTIDKAGKYAFEVNQFYSNGTAAHWDGPPDSDRPAPVLTVTAAGTAPVTNTTAKPHEGSPAVGPGNTAASSRTTTTAPATSVTTAVEVQAPTTTAAGESPQATLALEKSDGNGGPSWPLVGFLAAGLAAAAVVVWRRRRRI